MFSGDCPGGEHKRSAPGKDPLTATVPVLGLHWCPNWGPFVRCVGCVHKQSPPRHSSKRYNQIDGREDGRCDKRASGAKLGFMGKPGFHLLHALDKASQGPTQVFDEPMQGPPTTASPAQSTGTNPGDLIPRPVLSSLLEAHRPVPGPRSSHMLP